MDALPSGLRRSGQNGAILAAGGDECTVAVWPAHRLFLGMGLQSTLGVACRHGCKPIPERSAARCVGVFAGAGGGAIHLPLAATPAFKHPDAASDWQIVIAGQLPLVFASTFGGIHGLIGLL